jgi:hypothetical protein
MLGTESVVKQLVEEMEEERQQSREGKEQM